MTTTYNASREIRDSRQCHSSRANIGWVDLRAIDEAGGIDEQAIKEDKEHDGEHCYLLASNVRICHSDVLGQHGNFDDQCHKTARKACKECLEGDISVDIHLSLSPWVPTKRLPVLSTVRRLKRLPRAPINV